MASAMRTTRIMRPARLAKASTSFLRLQSAASARTASQSIRFSSSLPTVASVSFWKSLIPKPFRRSEASSPPSPAPKPTAKRRWNPASFYIFIFILIGSMAIQMIRIRTNFEAFMRQSDVRIGLLREVVEKLQKGEEVDVERMLGSGDAEKEKEWEEVLREIERGGQVPRRKNAPAEQKQGQQQQQQQSPRSTNATASSDTVESRSGSAPDTASTASPSPSATSNFY